MQNRAFHFELKDLLTQFIAAFDDVVIGRHNKNREELEQIKVRYIHAPKERIIYDLVNKAQNITLPVVSISVTSLARAEKRVFNKIPGMDLPIKKTEEPKAITHIPMPVPVDVQVSMSILASYQSDLDQIISNFAAYSNPYIILSWKIPSEFKLSDINEIRSKVMWDGSISYEYPIDIDASAKPRFIATTNFTIEGWLFPEAPTDDIKQIYFVNANLHSTRLENLDSDTSYNILSADNAQYVLSSGLHRDTETVSVSGIPSITNIYRYSDRGLAEIYKDTTYTIDLSSNQTRSFLILGENLKWCSSIVLSSNNTSLYSNLTSFNFTYYPSVTGFIIPPENYDILSDTTINLTLPELSGTGNINIILMDFVGYSDTKSISAYINSI